MIRSQRPVTFNVAALREFLPLGQRVERFAIDIDKHGAWSEWICKSAIGAHRLIRGPEYTTRRVRLRIVESPVCPAISEISLFYDAQTAEPRVPGASQWLAHER